jgi:hypothetical protein
LKPKPPIPLSDLSDLELEVSLKAVLERCQSTDENEKREAEARHSILSGELEYRAARVRDVSPGESGKQAERLMLSMAVSKALFTRLEGIARMEGRILPDIFRDAVLREADRLERKAMIDRPGEGRKGLIKYKRDRKKGRDLRR